MFTHNVINVGFHSNINIDNNITKRKKKMQLLFKCLFALQIFISNLVEKLAQRLVLLLNMYLQTVLRLHSGTLR